MSNNIDIPEIAITLEPGENPADNDALTNINESLTDVEDLEEGEVIKKSRSKLKIKLDNVDDGAVTDLEDLEGSDSDDGSIKAIQSISLQNVTFEASNCEELVKDNKQAKGSLQKQLSCFRDTLQVLKPEEDLLTDTENFNTDAESTESEDEIPDADVNLDEFQPEIIQDTSEFKAVENNVATKTYLNFPKVDQSCLTDLELVDSDSETEVLIKKTQKTRRRKSAKNCMKNSDCKTLENASSSKSSKRCARIKKSMSQPISSSQLQHYRNAAAFDSDGETEGKCFLQFPVCQKASKNRNMILTDTEDLEDDENKLIFESQMCKSFSNQSIRSNSECTTGISEKENFLSLHEALDSLNSTDNEYFEGDNEPKKVVEDIILPPPNRMLILLHEDKSIIPTTQILPLLEDQPTGLRVDNYEDDGLTDIENFDETDLLDVIDEYERGPTPDLCGYEGSSICYEDNRAYEANLAASVVEAPVTDTEFVAASGSRRKRTKKSSKKSHLTVDVAPDLPTTDTEDLYLNEKPSKSPLSNYLQIQNNSPDDGGTDVEEFDTDDENFVKDFTKSKILIPIYLNELDMGEYSSHDQEGKITTRKPAMLEVDSSNVNNANLTDVEDLYGSADEEAPPVRSSTATPNEFDKHLEMQQSSKVRIESSKRIDVDAPNEIMYLKGGSYLQTVTDVEDISADENTETVSVNVKDGSVCFEANIEWDVAKKSSPTEKSPVAQDAEQQAAANFITYESVLLAPDCNLPSTPKPLSSYKQIDDMLEKMLVEVEKQEKLFCLDLDLLEPNADDSFVNTLELVPETDALIEIPIKKAGLYSTFQEIQIDTSPDVNESVEEEAEEMYLEDKNRLSVVLVKDAKIASTESLTDNEYLNKEIENEYEPIEYNALTHAYQRFDHLPDTDIWFEGTYRNLSIVPEEDEEENVSLLSNFSTANQSSSLSSNRYSCYDSFLQQPESELSDSDDSTDDSEIDPSYEKGESIVKAEVKLLVKTTDRGKEAIEIRSVREFLENSPTSKPLETSKKSQFGEKLATFRNKISSIVDRSKKNLSSNLAESESSENLVQVDGKKPSFTFQQLFVRTPEPIEGTLQKDSKKFGSRTELVVNSNDRFPLEFNPAVPVIQESVDLHANIPFYPCYNLVESAQYGYKPVSSPHTNPFTETISNPFNESDQIPRAYCDWLEELSGGLSTTTERLVASNEEKLLDKPLGQQPLNGLSDIDDNLVIDLEPTLNQTNAFIQSESQPEPHDDSLAVTGKKPPIVDRKSDDNKNNINEKKKAKKGFFGSIKTFVEKSFESDSDSEKSPKKSKKTKKDKKKKSKDDDDSASSAPARKPKLPTPPLEPHDLENIPYAEASPSDLPPPYKPPDIPQESLPVTDLDAEAVEVKQKVVTEEPPRPTSPKKKLKSKTVVEITKKIEPLVIESEEFTIVVDPTKEESPKKSKETFTINIDESIEKIEKEILEKSPILSEEKIVKPLADLDLSSDIPPVKPLRLRQNIYEDIEDPVVSPPPDHFNNIPEKFEKAREQRRVSYKEEPDEIIDRVYREEEKEIVEKQDKELSKEKKGGFFGLFKKRDSKDSSVEKKTLSTTVLKSMEDSDAFLKDEVDNYHDVRPVVVSEEKKEPEPEVKEETKEIKEEIQSEEEKTQSGGFFGLFKKSKKDEEIIEVKQIEKEADVPEVNPEEVEKTEIAKASEQTQESKQSGGLFGMFKKSKKDEPETKTVVLSDVTLKHMEDTTQFLNDEVSNYEDVKIVKTSVSETVLQEVKAEEVKKVVAETKELVKTVEEKPIEADAKAVETSESSGFFGFFKKTKKEDEKPEKQPEITEKTIVESTVEEVKVSTQETKKPEDEVILQTSISRESSPKPSGFFGLFKKSKKDEDVLEPKPAIPEAALREIDDTNQFILSEVKNYHDVRPLKFDLVEQYEETIDLTKPSTTTIVDIDIQESKAPASEISSQTTKEKIVTEEVIERSPKPSRGLFSIFRKSKDGSQETPVSLSETVLKEMNDTNQFLMSEVQNYHDVKPEKFEPIKVLKEVKAEEQAVESSPKPSRGFFSSLFKKSKEDSVETQPPISETTLKQMNETDQFLVDEVQNYEDVKPVTETKVVQKVEETVVESSPKSSRGLFGLLKKSKEQPSESVQPVSETVLKEMNDTKQFLVDEVEKYHDVKPEKFEAVDVPKPVEEPVEVSVKQSKGLFGLFKKSKEDSVEAKPALSETAVKEMHATKEFLHGEVDRFEDVKPDAFEKVADIEIETKISKTDDKEVEASPKPSRGIFGIFKKSKKDEDDQTDTKGTLSETVLKDMHDSNEFLNKEKEKYHDVMPTIVISEHPPPKVESSGFLSLFKKSKKDEEEPQEIYPYVYEIPETVQKETKEKEESSTKVEDGQEPKTGFLAKFKITKKRPTSQEPQISEETLKHMVDTGNFLKNELENYEDGILVVDKKEEKVVTFQEPEKETVLPPITVVEAELPQLELVLESKTLITEVTKVEPEIEEAIAAKVDLAGEEVPDKVTEAKVEAESEVKKPKKDKYGKDKKGFFNIFGKKSKSQDATQDIKRDEEVEATKQKQKRRKSSSPFKFFEKSKKSEDETKDKNQEELEEKLPEVDLETKDDILTIEFDEQPSLAEEVLSSLDKKMENLKSNYSVEILKKMHDCRDFLFIEVDNYDDAKPVVVTDIDKDLEEVSKLAASKTVDEIIDLATTTLTEELKPLPEMQPENIKATEIEPVLPAEPEPTKPKKPGFFSKIGNFISGAADETANEIKKGNQSAEKHLELAKDEASKKVTEIGETSIRKAEELSKAKDNVVHGTTKLTNDVGKVIEQKIDSAEKVAEEKSKNLAAAKDSIVDSAKQKITDVQTALKEKSDEAVAAKDSAVKSASEKCDEFQATLQQQLGSVQEQSIEVVDTISDKATEIKISSEQKAKELQTSLEKKSDELNNAKTELVDSVAEKLEDSKLAASQKLEQKSEELSKAKGQIINGAAKEVEQIKDAAAQKSEQLSKAKTQIIDRAAQKLSDVKSAAAEKTEELGKVKSDTAQKLQDAKLAAAQKIDKKSEELSKAKSKIIGSAAQKLDDVKSEVAQKTEEINEAKSQIIDEAAQKLQDAKLAASQKIDQKSEELSKAKSEIIFSAAQKLDDVKSAAAQKTEDLNKAKTEIIDEAAQKLQDAKLAAFQKIDQKSDELSKAKTEIIGSAAQKLDDVKSAAAQKTEELNKAKSEIIDETAQILQDAKLAASQKIDQKADELSKTKNEIIDSAAQKLDDVKSAAAQKTEELNKAETEIIDEAAQKLQDAKLAAAQKIYQKSDELSKAKTDIIDSAAQKLDYVKSTAAQKAEELNKAKSEIINDAAQKIEVTKSSGAEKIDTLKKTAEISIEKTSQKLEDVKKSTTERTETLIAQTSEKMTEKVNDVSAKKQEIIDATSKELDNAKQAAKDGLDELTNTKEKVFDFVSLKVEESKQVTQEKIQTTIDAKDKLVAASTQKVEDAKLTINKKLESAKDSAVKAKKTTEQKIDYVKSAVHEKIESSKDKAFERLAETKQSFEQTVKDVDAAKDSISQKIADSKKTTEEKIDSAVKEKDKLLESSLQEIHQAKDTISDKGEKTKSNLAENLSDATHEIDKSIKNNVDAGSQKLQNVFSIATDKVATKKDELTKTAAEKSNEISSQLHDSISATKTNLQDLKQDADRKLDTLTKTKDNILETTEQAIQKSKESAQMKSADLSDKVSQKIDSIKATSSQKIVEKLADGLTETKLVQDQEVKLQQIDEELAKLTSSLGPIVGETSKKSKKQTQSYVTAPTRRAVSQKYTNDQRPTVIEVARMQSEEELPDEEQYTVTEPDEDDDVDSKRKPLFHLESEEDETVDVVAKPRERSDSVKSNVLETLTENKLDNLLTSLENQVAQDLHQTVTENKEVKSAVAESVAQAEETLETLKKDSQADVDQIEQKLRDLDKALESLEQASDDPKLERKLHRVERKFERMASEAMEDKDNNVEVVSPTQVEARREHEFQRLVSQLSTEEVSDFQKEYSHLWDETTFSKSDEWDSKTPDSQVDVQELPQGEVVYLGPVTLNKDNLVNKAGIEVDVIPIMKSPCHSPKPPKKNKRAKSAMDFYDGRSSSRSLSTREFDRGSLPDLKAAPLLKTSLVHTILQMNPDRFLYGSASSLKSTASSSTATVTSELSKGEIMSAVLDWLEKSSPASQSPIDTASLASSSSSLSQTKPNIPTIRISGGKSKKHKANSEDRFRKDVRETACAPTVTEETKIIPQPKPRFAKEPQLQLNKIQEAQQSLTKPDKQISPVRDDLLDDEETVPETYSDKKKFWESVGSKEPIATKRMSLHDVSATFETKEVVTAKKRMSIHEFGTVPTPKPRSVQLSQSIDDTTTQKSDVITEEVASAFEEQVSLVKQTTGEVSHVSEAREDDKKQSPKEQSPKEGKRKESRVQEEESPVDDRIMTEYQASFMPPSEMKRKSPPKVESDKESSDSESEVQISDSGDVEHYISDSEIEDRVPQIRERQMSVFAAPVAAVRKTIYERSSSLPTEDLYEVSARSIKLRKQYYEEQIKKEMIEEQLTSELEEEPSPERKTLFGTLVEQSSEDRTASSVQDLVHAFDQSIRHSIDDVNDIQDFMEITEKKEVSFDESHKPDIKTQLEDQGAISISPIISETHKEIDLETQTNRFSVGSEHSSSSKGTKDESTSKPDSMEVHVDKSEIEDSEKLAELDQDATDIETKSLDSLNATEMSPKSSYFVDEHIPEITVTLSGKQRRISEESDEYAPKTKAEAESPINVPEEHVEDTVWEVSVQSQPEARFDEKAISFDTATVAKIEKEEDLSLSTRDESDLGSEIHQDHSDSYASDKIKSDSHSDIERIILDSLHHQKVDPVEAKAIASALIEEIETEIERRECLPPATETRDVSDYLKYLAETKGLDEREVELVESVLARRQRELAKLSRGDTQASSIEITDEDLRYSGTDLVDTTNILEQQMSQLKAEQIDDMKSMAFLDRIDEKLIEETHTSRDYETYSDGGITGHKSELHTKTFEGVKSEKTETKDTIFEEDETISESTTHEYEQKDSRVEAVAVEESRTKTQDSEVEELRKSAVDIKKEHSTDITAKTTTTEADDSVATKLEDTITESDTIKSTIRHEIEMTERKDDEEIKLKGELVTDDFLRKEATTKIESTSEVKELADGCKVEKAEAIEQTHRKIVHKAVIGEETEETHAHKDEDCTIKQSKTSSTTTSIDVHRESATSSEVTEKIETFDIDPSQLVDTLGEIKTVVVKHEEIKRTSSSDSKSSLESSGKSPDEQFSTCSSGRKGDSDTSKIVEKPEVLLRKSISLQKPDRKSGIDFEAYSSSGESHYHSFDLDSGKSRPCSSDVEGLVAAGSSEYESALTSQDYSGRSHITSTEYQTAVSSLSSKESMKSLDSESSGHLGSIEVSEVSETLVPSASDLEGDILDTGDQQLLEDESWTSEQSNDVVENELIDTQSKMKRSHEMTFQPEPKVLPASESPQPDETDKKLFTSMDEGSVVSMSLSSTSATEPQTVIELSRTDSERGGSMTVSGTSGQLSIEGSCDSLVFHPPVTTSTTTTDISTSTGNTETNVQIESITFTTSVVDESGVIRSVSTQVTSETHTPEEEKPVKVEAAAANGSCHAEMKKKGHRRQESTSFVPPVLTAIKTEVEQKIHSELAESDKYTAELSLKEVISDEKKDVDEKEKEESYETEADQGFHQDVRAGKYQEEPEDEIKDDTPEFSSETQASVGELEQEYTSALARTQETKKKPEASSSELHFHKEPLEKRDSHGKSSSTSSEKSSFEEAEAEAAFNMVAHISPAHKIKQICPILEDEDAEKHELETRERAQKEFEKRRSQIRDQSPGAIPDIKVTQHMTPLVDRNFHYPDLELEEQERLKEERESEAQKSTPQTPSSKSSEDTDQGREYVLEDSGISIPEESATESKSTVIEQTFKDDADKDTDSPNSDSFEMLEKPDLIDDFVVIEEVAKEAQEFDSEGKSVHIQQKTSGKKKKHDEEVEAYLTRSAPTPLTRITDVKYFPDGSSSDELGFEFEDSPPINNAGTATSYDQELEANKKWIEQQFQGDQAARVAAGYDDYEMEFERGPLEDIKEEDINDFDASSRIGSLGSQKESGGSLGGSIKDSYSSTPEYDVLAGRKYFTRSGEHDDISMSSLQEFETLERAMSLETRKYHQGSQDSSSNGSFKTRYYASKSGQGDDVSVSSLKEFEGLEMACIAAHTIETKAKEEEAMLAQIDEGQESLASESESVETISRTDKKLIPDSDEEDYEKRMFEIDEIIRQAQTNVERFIELKEGDKTESLGRGDSIEEVSKVPDLELDVPLVRSSVKVQWKESDAMVTSTDSIDGKPEEKGSHHDSTDSLDQKTGADIMTASTDSIEFQSKKTEPINLLSDSIEIKDVDEACGGMISSDSLELGAHQKPSAEDLMMESTDSLVDVTSSTATHATYQYETDSVFSGSFTSGGSNTMVSSTDTIEPVHVDIGVAARKVWFDEEAAAGTSRFSTEYMRDTGKPYVTEVIEPCEGDEFSHTIHRRVELPPEVRKVTFYGSDADDRLKQFIEDFNEGEHVEEIEEVDEAGNIHTKRIVQKRFIVKGGDETMPASGEMDQFLKKSLASKTNQLTTAITCETTAGEDSGVASSTGQHDSSSLKAQASRRRQLRYDISVDDQIEVDPREHDWRFNLPEHVEGEESASGSTETVEKSLKSVSDQHQLSDEMKELLKELEKESKQ